MYLASFSGFDGIYWRDARRSSPLFSPLIFYSCFFYLYRFVHLFCLENNKHVVAHSAHDAWKKESLLSGYSLHCSTLPDISTTSLRRRRGFDRRRRKDRPLRRAPESTTERRRDLRQRFGRRLSSAYGDSVRRKPYGKIWTNWRLRLVPCYVLSGVRRQPLLAVEDLMIACPSVPFSFIKFNDFSPF